MLTELGKRLDKHSENFNRERQNVKRNHSEPKKTITEIKTRKKDLAEEWVAQRNA